jgi:hypothetical protein
VDEDPHLERVLRDAGVPGLLEALERLPGADLTTLLLHLARRRVASMSPAEVIRRYETDRFVRPGPVAHDRLVRAEQVLLAALPSGFEVVTLAPVVPLGTHASVAAADQNRVVSTTRNTEVAADPTNGLALEAAVRRRDLLQTDPRSAERVRLAGCQRVVRGQRFEDEAMLAHFGLFGLVTAGRDTGNRGFEREAAVEHAAFAVDALVSIGVRDIEVRPSDLRDGFSSVVDDLHRVFADREGVLVVDRPDREDGRGYYAGFCFKVRAGLEDESIEVADGGLVDWTQRLVSSAKERLFISGLGLERVAALLS